MNKVCFRDKEGVEQTVPLVLSENESINDVKIRICVDNTFLWLFYSKETI